MNALSKVLFFLEFWKWMNALWIYNNMSMSKKLAQFSFLSKLIKTWNFSYVYHCYQSQIEWCMVKY